MDIPFAAPKQNMPMYSYMVKLVDLMNMALKTISLENKVGGNYDQFHVATSLSDFRKVLYDIYQGVESMRYKDLDDQVAWMTYGKMGRGVVVLSYSYDGQSFTVTHIQENSSDIANPGFYYSVQFEGSDLFIGKKPYIEHRGYTFDGTFRIPASAFGFNTGTPASSRPGSGGSSSGSGSSGASGGSRTSGSTGVVGKTPGKTFIVMQKDTGFDHQIWFLSGKDNPLQEDKIKENWSNKQITAAACTSRGWFIAMSTRQPGVVQSYKLSNSCPLDWVAEKRYEGYMIIAVTTSGTQWFTVVSKGTPYKAQVHCYADWDTVKEFISTWWNEDYYITHATWFNGKWFIVMSKSDLYTEQGYFYADDYDELKQKISERWNGQKNINLIEHDDSSIFCVMSKMSRKYVGECYSYTINSLESFIQEGYDKGYMISYLGD